LRQNEVSEDHGSSTNQQVTKKESTMSENATVVLSFTGTSADEGNYYANDLKNSLLDLSPRLQVERRRERDDSQDFGGTLALVLGTTAVNALAHGIAAWLRRNAGARISVNKANGELVAQGLDSKDVAGIVKALSTASQSV
jgi:hypothetical protein